MNKEIENSIWLGFYKKVNNIEIGLKWNNYGKNNDIVYKEFSS